MESYITTTSYITVLEYTATQIRAEVATAYNAHRDAADRLCNIERKLAEARKEEMK